MKQLFTLFISMLFISNFGISQNVGDSAPDFMLNDLNNMKYTLSANRGNVVMIFLVGYSCPLCIASSPKVQSTVISPFQSNEKFQALVIDTWNGSKGAFQNFKNSTNMDARYLQKGQSVANNLSMSYDRLVVVDSSGKIVFKGTRAAGSDVNAAKAAVQNALNNITTSANLIENNNGYWVSQNFPNPVRGNTHIEFTLPQTSDVNISIFDITGKLVLNPVNQQFESGNHQIEIPVSDIQGGIYFYRFVADDYSTTHKMIIE